LPAGTRVVTHPGAAALLDDASRRVYLHPFLDRACTLADAARELGVPMNTMHYWLRKLLDVDLVEVVEVRRRPGRAIQVYRSVASAFFVPFAATPADSVESQLVSEEVERQRRLSRLMAKTLRDASPHRGLLLRRESEGMIRSSTHPPHEPSDVVFSSWIERPLSKARAAEVQAELRALVERLAALPTDEGDASFVLRVALVPSGETS